MGGYGDPPTKSQIIPTVNNTEKINQIFLLKDTFLLYRAEAQLYACLRFLHALQAPMPQKVRHPRIYPPGNPHNGKARDIQSTPHPRKQRKPRR